MTRNLACTLIIFCYFFVYTKAGCSKYIKDVPELAGVVCLKDLPYSLATDREYYRITYTNPENQDAGAVECTLRVAFGADSETERSNYQSLGFGYGQTFVGIETRLLSTKTTDGSYLLDIVAENYDDNLTFDYYIENNRSALIADEKILLKPFTTLIHGVTKLHQLNKVMGDFNYERMFITKDGSVVISDFTTIYDLDSQHPVSSESSIYMQPEEFIAQQTGEDNKFDSWGDLYPVGILLYQTIFGKDPYQISDIGDISDFDNMEIGFFAPVKILSRSILWAMIKRFSSGDDVNVTNLFLEMENIPEEYFNVAPSFYGRVEISSEGKHVLADWFINQEKTPDEIKKISYGQFRRNIILI